jgi:hypothetical protein
MSDQFNNNINVNPWNPFITTKRDIVRTSELGSKNAVVAGALTFIFFPAGLLYLNRGINSLKIIGYIFAVSFLLSIVTKADENSPNFSSLISLIGTGAITFEQVMAVKKARQRPQESSSSLSTYSLDKNHKDSSGFETNQEAVKLLKQIKEQYEANEISEEEFKIQKQQILNSL